MNDLDLETVVRQMVTAAADNHGRGEHGMTTVRSTQFPVLERERVALTGRLQALGVGYEVGPLLGAGGIYVSIMNDGRAHEAVRRNWTAVEARNRTGGPRGRGATGTEAGPTQSLNPSETSP